MDEMLTKGFPAVDGVETTEDTEDGFGFRKGVPDIGGESAEGNAESLREFSEQPIPVADDARAGHDGYTVVTAHDGPSADVIGCLKEGGPRRWVCFEEAERGEEATWTCTDDCNNHVCIFS